MLRLNLRYVSLLGALIGVLITNMLCLPLLSDYDAWGFIRTLFNKETPIDIGYIGDVTGGDAIDISAKPVLSDTQWIVDSKNTHRFTAKLRSPRRWTEYTITLKSRRQGGIFIKLKGPNDRDDYGRMRHVFVDYKNLRICDKVVFSDVKKLSHEKNFEYRMPVKAGEEVQVTFDVRRHHINLGDFNLLEEENFWYIITLSIASFVVFYVLLYRLSALHQQRRGVDTVFLICFFFLLTFPLCNISDVQGRSISQNRVLARRPEISSILRENSDFGKKYEQWFTDHLAGRMLLIHAHSFLRNHISSIIRTPKALYFKDSGWMFNIWSLQPHNRSTVRPIIDNLTAFDRFLRENKVKLYILEVPLKEFVYKNEWRGYPVVDKSVIKEFEETHRKVQSICRSRHIPFTCPLRELQGGAASDYTYFKWGHHWTFWGAYLGYRALIGEVRKDFPDVSLQAIGSFEKHYNTAMRDLFDDSQRVSEFPSLFDFDVDNSHITKYTYYYHKHRDMLTKRYYKWYKEFSYHHIRGGGV